MVFETLFAVIVGVISTSVLLYSTIFAALLFHNRKNFGFLFLSTYCAMLTFISCKHLIKTIPSLFSDQLTSINIDFNVGSVLLLLCLYFFSKKNE